MFSNCFSMLHLELTTRCEKNCWMCRRQEYDIEAKDMPLRLVETIEWEVPRGTVVQFHNRGEPLEYPEEDLAYVLEKFDERFRTFTTNGLRLGDMAETLMGRLEAVAVSIIENDSQENREMQEKQVKKFLEIRGKRLLPRVIVRLLGSVGTEIVGDQVVWRQIHARDMSHSYKKRDPTAPEYGVCLEALTRLSVDVDGWVSPCVRFDPQGEGRFGKIEKRGDLHDIWNGRKRQEFLQKHIEGRREELPLCGRCDFWGIPRD